MNLTLQRSVNNIGQLAVDGENFCLILENPMLKIPAGTYQIALLYSPRFRRYNPHILNVPGRAEIEMHTGNYYYDSKGCLICGTDEMPGNTNPRNGIEPWVDGSTVAYEALIRRLIAYCFNDPMAQYDPCEITIIDPVSA